MKVGWEIGITPWAKSLLNLAVRAIELWFILPYGSVVKNVLAYVSCLPRAAWSVDGVDVGEVSLCDGLVCIYNSLQFPGVLDWVNAR